MKVSRTHALMVSGRVKFCEVVSIIVASGFPIDVELLLVYSVTDPVETHVNGFGTL